MESQGLAGFVWWLHGRGGGGGDGGASLSPKPVLLGLHLGWCDNNQTVQPFDSF